MVYRPVCGYNSLLNDGPKASFWLLKVSFWLLFPRDSCAAQEGKGNISSRLLGMNWTDSSLGLSFCVLEMGVCVFFLLSGCVDQRQ